MKNFTLILICIFSSKFLFAQNSTISLGVGYSDQSFYLRSNGIPIGLIYDYEFGKRLTFSTNLNLIKAEWERTGNTTIGTTSNTYSFTEKERILQGDLSILYCLMDNSKKINTKIGGGISLAQSKVTYPVDIFIQNGIIIKNIEGTYKAASPLLNIVFDQSFQVASKINIGLRGTFRTTGGKDVKPLTRIIKSADGFTSGTQTSITGINFGYDIVVKLGYSF
jgi:hypothetical protein